LAVCAQPQEAVIGAGRGSWSRTMIVDSAHYKDGARQHERALTPEQAAELRGKAGSGEFVWIGIHEPEPGDLERLESLFGLHELAVEDAQNPHQRPKIEDYDQDIFIVLKTAHYHEDREEVHFGEIHLFAGPGYIITVRHGPGSELASARQSLEARPDLLKLGAASAVWAVVDKVVDDYIPVADAIEDDVEEVEKDVFDDDIPAPTARIYNLKREVIEFHRAVWPLLVPLTALEQGGYERIPDELVSYFRDVADHARRVDEQVSSQRELLTSVLQANLALVSVNQNIVVKKISAVAGIIAVPTFIASVYGMNFDNMPELHWHFGYAYAVALMALCVVGLVAFFRRIDWI
jgi:magnesium transporter